MTDLTGYPGADAAQGRLVRQRHLPRGALARAPRARARAHAEARRPARGRGLPRLLRGRLPRRRRHRRALPGRDQPAHQRRDLDDQRDAPAPTPTCRCSSSTCSSTSTSTTRSTSTRSTAAGRRPSSIDVWSQLVLKETGDDVELLTAAPQTGIWRLDDGGGASSSRAGATTGTASTTSPRRSSCACSAPGDYRYPGADLGVLVARSRMQTDDNELTDRGARSGSTASTRSSPARRCPTQPSRCRPARWRSRRPSALASCVGDVAHVPRGRRAAARRPLAQERFEATWPALPSAGTCATATPRGRRYATAAQALRRAHARARRRRGSGSSSSPAAATWPRACSRCATRRRWSPAARRRCSTRASRCSCATTTTTRSCSRA